ncbi:hypothetical protein L1049_000087 [Liquidambar formosana]|uniref:Uncharacterized protein n=1 Tax=Liquidambar formosana TaxID=63359 RepID=A0AAP0N862_LIQFO
MASTSINTKEAEITFMDPSLYKAVAEGNVLAFNEYANRLQNLVIANKNIILYIHITAQCVKTPERTDFVREILTTCPFLLFQKNAKEEIPLHIVARYGRSEIVRVLIKHTKVAEEDLLERGEEGRT